MRVIISLKEKKLAREFFMCVVNKSFKINCLFHSYLIHTLNTVSYRKTLDAKHGILIMYSQINL